MKIPDCLLQAGLLVLHQLDPGVVDTSIRATVGASIPAVLFLFLARTASRTACQTPGRLCALDGLHLLPAIWVFCLFQRPQWASAGMIDGSLVLIEAAYAIALLSLDRSRDRKDPIRRRLLLLAAGFLLAEAVLDVFISIEIAASGSISGSQTLSWALGLVVALMLALFAWAWRDPEWLGTTLGAAREISYQLQAAPPESAVDLEGAQQLCQELDAYLERSQDFLQFGLSLDDVAKRMRVPARQLSEAINRVHGRGFRTLLNDRRVDAAARLLEDPSKAGQSILELMFDAGFQTKSSFNKEFVQRKGVSPRDFRQGKRK